jgi:hypothetical protein
LDNVEEFDENQGSESNSHDNDEGVIEQDNSQEHNDGGLVNGLPNPD